VITADRLQKFNAAQGTVAGNQHEEIAARENEAIINEFAQGDLDVVIGEEG